MFGRSKNTHKKLAQNIAVYSAGCAESLAKQYPAKDKPELRLSDAILFLVMFQLNIAKRTLRKRMKDKDADKIIEELYISILSSYLFDNYLNRETQINLLKNLYDFEKKFLTLPLSNASGKPGGTLLWEFGKYIHIVLTGDDLDDMTAVMNIASTLMYMNRQSNVVKAAMSLDY